MEGPTNHTVPIGATVTFHCIAQGDDAFFEINDTAIYHLEDMNRFNEKGFSLREEFTDTFNFSMTVNAMPENNNTRITCWVFPPEYLSGNLTVMGKKFTTHYSLIMYTIRSRVYSLLHYECLLLILNTTANHPIMY